MATLRSLRISDLTTVLVEMLNESPVVLYSDGAAAVVDVEEGGRRGGRGDAAGVSRAGTPDMALIDPLAALKNSAPAPLTHWHRRGRQISGESKPISPIGERADR